MSATVQAQNEAAPARAMVPLSAAIDALVSHFAFAPSRARTVARRLQDAGTLPLGTHSSPPMCGVRDVINLTLALAADVTLRETPGAVAEIATLGWLQGVKPSPDSTAASFLEGVCELALRGDKWPSEIAIEVIPEWRRVEIHFDGVTESFGADAQPHRGARRSTTIPGAAFAEAVRDLFQ